jgi:heterodisulfide reductase subunit C
MTDNNVTTKISPLFAQEIIELMKEDVFDLSIPFRYNKTVFACISCSICLAVRSSRKKKQLYMAA